MRIVLIGCLFLITTLVLATPLIDKILTPEALNMMESCIDNIEFFIGSKNLNIFLVMICVLIVFTLYRRAWKFFTWKND